MWQAKFNMLNEKNLQPRKFYPPRLLFSIKGGIQFQKKKTQKPKGHQNNPLKNIKWDSLSGKDDQK